MSTIVEVAKRAKVSTATVSNVIRGTRKVSEVRTARVRAAIRELNYSPNEIARSLKVKQTRMLVMILPDLSNMFFPEIIRGAEHAAAARGYFLLTATTDEQVGRERRIVSMLRSYRVDGILLASAEGMHGQDTSHIADLVSAGVAVVSVDRSVPGVAIDAVLLDNEGGARECVRHLVKQGHQRIGFITGSLHLQTGEERLKGYKLGLEDAGIAVDEKLIAEGDFRLASGRKGALELLKLRPRPTALFVCNGPMALGALQVFDELKVSCPEDIALATFDEVSIDHAFHPHLTTVVQPSYDMGARAAEMLMDRIEGRAVKGFSLVRVAPKLVCRDSTATVIGNREGRRKRKS